MNEYNDNSKYAKYEANFGSEEINHFQPDPRDRDPGLAFAGEKLEYHGVHFRKG